MSIEKYTKFAVIGSGYYGSPVVQNLATTPGVSVRVLSRSADTVVPAGAKVVAVDYTSEASIESALNDIEVAICTLGPFGCANQDVLIKCAKKQGVKLFLPVEYGGDTRTVTKGPMFSMQVRVQNLLKEVGLPYLLVFNGIWPEYCIKPHFGFDWANKKASVVGTGNEPLTFTTAADSARFLVHVLTTQPASSFTNSVLRIQGNRETWNSVIKIYEDTHPGVKIDVTYRDLESVSESLGPDPGYDKMMDYLLVNWAHGETDFEKDGVTPSNDLWKEWKPKTIKGLLESL